MAVVALSCAALGACFLTALRMARRGWGAGAFFVAVYGAFYFVAPAYFALAASFGEPRSPEFLANATLGIPFAVLPVALGALFALVFVLTYDIAASRPVPAARVVARTVSLFGRRISVPWVLALGVGLLGYWGLVHYVNQYGGFAEAAAVASLVRAGFGSDFQMGESVFSYRFADVSFVCFAVAMSASSWPRRSAAVLLGLPFLAFVALLAKGKANLLAFLVVPFIYYSLARQKRLGGVALALGGTTVLAVPVLQQLLFGEASVPGVDASTLERVVQFVSHPYVSTAAALEYRGSFLLLNDFVAGLGGQVVPTAWLVGVAPYSSIELNTSLISGEFARVIPPGPVAFGYYSGGLLGVIAWSAIVAILCAYVDRLVMAARGNPAVTFIMACVVFTLSNGVYHGVPEFVLYFHRVLICAVFFVAGYRVDREARAPG